MCSSNTWISEKLGKGNGKKKIEFIAFRDISFNIVISTTLDSFVLTKVFFFLTGELIFQFWQIYTTCVWPECRGTGHANSLREWGSYCVILNQDKRHRIAITAFTFFSGTRRNITWQGVSQAFDKKLHTVQLISCHRKFVEMLCVDQIE